MIAIATFSEGTGYNCLICTLHTQSGITVGVSNDCCQEYGGKSNMGPVTPCWTCRSVPHSSHCLHQQ